MLNVQNLIADQVTSAVPAKMHAPLNNVAHKANAAQATTADQAMIAVLN